MNYIDRIIDYINPVAGAKRAAYRSATGLQASYQGAISTRLSTPWGQSESYSGLPHLNLTAARNMRDRARSLVENNPLASSILSRATENIIGNGLQLQVLTDSPTWNRKAEELMGKWFPTCDYYGRSWVQHQRLLCNGLLRDGDIGGALLSKGQVQLVEGDYISSPYTTNNAFLHDGIELGPSGRIKQFWIMTYVDQLKRDFRQVAPQNFLYVANRKRVTQYRGETFFAQTFDLFDQIKGYVDAVVLAQKIAACLAVFIRTSQGTGALSGLGYGKNSDGVSQRQFTLEPGMIQSLKPGEDISQINPSQPGSGFDANLRMLLRLLGLPFGQPLELVLLDFSQTNYSSAKASLLQAQRAFEAVQRLLIDEYFADLYRWRISKFIKDGELEARDDAFNHQWHAEPWPYLDPVKEVQAAILEIDAGLNTERRAIMARGGNPDQMMQERSEELAQKRELDIPIYHTNYVIELGTKVKDSKEENVGTPESTGDTTVLGDAEKKPNVGN